MIGRALHKHRPRIGVKPHGQQEIHPQPRRQVAGLFKCLSQFRVAEDGPGLLLVPAPVVGIMVFGTSEVWKRAVPDHQSRYTMSL